MSKKLACGDTGGRYGERGTAVMLAVLCGGVMKVLTSAS
jgi:hypothetical protein